MRKCTALTTAADRRQKDIKSCLKELLEIEPYDRITVMEICRKIGVTRKVFYKHFRGKEDCFYNLIDDVLADNQAYIATNLPDWDQTVSSFAVVIESWRQQEDFLRIIDSNHLYELLMERAMLYIQKEDRTTIQLLDNPHMPCDEDILSCYLSCLFTLVFNWYERGYDSSVEEIANKFLWISKGFQIRQF